MVCDAGMKCAAGLAVAAAAMAAPMAGGAASAAKGPFNFEEELLRTVEMERNQPAFLEEVSADGELGKLLSHYRMRAFRQTDIPPEYAYSCLIFSPRGIKDKAIPLVVYVPGTGEIGENLIRQFNQRGLFDKVTGAEFQKRHPCHLLAVSPPKTVTSFCASRIGEPNGEQRRLRNLVEGARLRVEGSVVDTNRIYITGLSFGGSAAGIVAQSYPGYFAAAVPVSGVIPPAEGVSAERPGNWWFFRNGAHTDANAMFFESLRRYQAAVNELGGDCRVGGYPNSGHNAWNSVWREDDMWDWMFSKSLAGDVRSRGGNNRSKSAYVAIAIDDAVCSASVPGVDVRHGPERVVDGLHGTAYVAARAFGRSDWWMVDFRREVSGHACIRTGDEKGGRKLRGAKVEISRDGKIWRSAGTVATTTGECRFSIASPVRFLRVRTGANKSQPFAISSLAITGPGR